MKIFTTLIIILLLIVSINASEISEISIESQLSANLNRPLLITNNSLNSNYYQSNNIYDDQSDMIDDNSKSVIKAGLYSFLIPGWGQYYNHKMTKGRIFFAAEVLTWVSYFSLRTYGRWRKDDMIRFGNSRAGADLEGKDEIFTGMMEMYMDIDEYNNIGRLMESDSPYYSPNSSYYWRWETEEDMATFRKLRERSREAYRASKWLFIIGLVNRVASVVDAVRDAKRADIIEHDDFLSSLTDSKFSLDINPMSYDKQINLTYYPGF